MVKKDTFFRLTLKKAKEILSNLRITSIWKLKTCFHKKIHERKQLLITNDWIFKIKVLMKSCLTLKRQLLRKLHLKTNWEPADPLLNLNSLRERKKEGWDGLVWFSKPLFAYPSVLLHKQPSSQRSKWTVKQAATCHYSCENLRCKSWQSYRRNIQGLTVPERM